MLPEWLVITPVEWSLPIFFYSVYEFLPEFSFHYIFAALAEITVVMCIELFYKSAKMINIVFDRTPFWP